MIGTRNSELWGWIILIVIVGCSLSTTELTSADGPPVQWQKAFGGISDDYVYSVQQTPDGGYIISGGTFSFGPGGSAVYLIKTDPNGDSQWLKTFGGDNYDWGHTARQTIDGGYIIVGRTKSFGAGYYDIYLIKTDPNGDSQWQKTFGGSEWDDGYSVQQTVDGGYIISGETNSFGAGYDDVYLIKTDPNGDSQWQKTIGGSDGDYGWSVEQTVESGYIITGGTYSFGAGSSDVYLIKTDPNGISQWQKTFGGNNLDYGCLVHQTSDGGYIITGQTESFGAGGNDVYLIKTEPNGSSQWQKTFGGSGDDYGYWVQQTLDGGYIIAGFTMSFGAGSNDAYLIKTNSNGNLLWEKTFGGNSSEIGCSVQQTIDGGYIIAGSTWSFGAEKKDVYLIKLCPEGTLSGDLNCDGTVNYEDVEILVSQWLQPRSLSYHADIYGVGDGIVDFLDYSTQAADFGKSSSPP